ncbi:hypothetical protein H5410_012324 [Solanum commersonii]|uniref:PGG domain-containing protein n=1 Tax=Solanum commersonii TaxID=4109 RepID=A0A9J6ASA6_SOLCO|nr:hypothetical protein H5410_012324 [Solanum commersonii]
MDRRLWEAAQKGDVHHLQTLIKEVPLFLREVSIAGSETPLHIACLGGHLEFTKEIIHLGPEFARKLNQDGFSPLHIASANGDIEIVKELLNVDSNLCLIKGKDRRIPLHYAVINGRENVMKELLVVSPDSTEEVTARGETCLHLAVKNHQFETFKLLLDNLKDFNKYDLLNKKDIQGNTVLHLAVSTKQYEASISVVDILLDENVVCKGTIEVNSLNKKGLTPLEECGDRDIEEILRASGALSAENLQVLVVPVQDQQSSREQTRDDGPRSNLKKLHDFFKYNKTKDPPGKVRDTLLVIAILIATATYQAGFNPPGGVWQDTYLPDNNNNRTSYDGIVAVPLRHFAGQSVMATNNPVSYGMFLVFNSLGFFVSLHVILFLTIGFPMQLELQISLFALAGTYIIVILSIIPFWGLFFLFLSSRLREAAQKGDVDHLQSLIKEVPFLLSTVSLAGSNETPLHIACLSLHLEFAKEIIHLRPEFARELNQDGFSPLHIASSKWRYRDCEGAIEVIKGRKHVIREILVASPDSAAEVTTQGETCLHLAVKNHQFEAFKLLLENLKEFDKNGLLNKKDIQGNTVLHLATSTKQFEVVDQLLDENLVAKGTIEVNSLNKGGLTPLEVLLKESGDRDIEEILTTSDAVSAETCNLRNKKVCHNLGLFQFKIHQMNNPAENKQDFFKYNKTKDCPGKVRDTLLVIAILIATATYQTVLSPPGGVWQDTYWPDHNNSSSSDGIMSLRRIAGQSVMGTNNPISYGLFLVFNSIGLFVSLHTINFLTIGFPLQLELQISLVALIATYDTVMSAITPNRGISLLFTIFSIVFPVFLPHITKLLRNHCKKPKFIIKICELFR